MTRRHRQRRRKGGPHRTHKLRRVLLIGAGVVTLTVVIAGLCIAGWVAAVASDVPAIGSLKPRIPGQISIVYAGNGQRIGYMGSDVVRIALAQDQQPSTIRNATVAIEDRRFWHHGAVDYEGFLRAAVKDVFEGGGIQGASTLTMQLVNNSYTYLQKLRSTQSLRYKIAQAKLATDLYDKHSRGWILTQYLNDVPYGTVDGRNAIGIAAASRMFFDKPVSDLDLAQYALLAGLPQAPSEYNPFENPSLAHWRRHLVLEAMLRSHYITRAQEQLADASPLQVKVNDTFTHVTQPYVYDYVRQQLVQDLGERAAKQHGLTPTANLVTHLGEQIVDRGGLKIYTTINLQDQEYAKQALLANEGQPGDPAASLVTVDPSNGHILAMQNSTSYGVGKGETTFNYAADAQRQTGSVFKAFVLMTLIHDQDGDPNSTYYNSSPLPAGWLPGYPSYSVANAAESDAQGDITVTKATTLSINAVYAQLGVDLGMTNVDSMAHAMGITSPLFGYPSEAIGGLRIGVSALQVADAYATIASYGDHHTATIISKVVMPSGQVVNLGDPKPTQVFSQGQAYAATQVLQTVIEDGTGTTANYGCPAAGKTGTTSNYTDAWFAGYTPKLSTAVWVGYPKSEVYMTDVNGLGPGFGGTLAAPIWRDYMQKASDGYCGEFPQPDSYWQGKQYLGAHAVSAPSTNPKKGKKGQSTSTTTTPTTSTPSTTTTTPTNSTPQQTTTTGPPNKSGGTGG